MASLFAEIVLRGHPLLKFPYEQSKKQLSLSLQSSSSLRAEAEQLKRCAEALATWYQNMTALPPSAFAQFTCAQWFSFVISIVAGIRMSFVIPNECHSWDHLAARRTLGLEAFLKTFSDGKSADTSVPPHAVGKGADVLSASRIVVSVVRDKYERRVAASQAENEIVADADHLFTVPPTPPSSMPPDELRNLQKCPMLDGSLSEYLKSWDEPVRATPVSMGQSFEAYGLENGSGSWSMPATESSRPQPTIYHDLWATMTMGWAREGTEDIDFSGI